MERWTILKTLDYVTIFLVCHLLPKLRAETYLEYNCPPVDGGPNYKLHDLYADGVHLSNTNTLSFQVKCSSNAYILLQRYQGDYNTDVVEIVLDAYQGNISIIRDKSDLHVDTFHVHVIMFGVSVLDLQVNHQEYYTVLFPGAPVSSRSMATPIYNRLRGQIKMMEQGVVRGTEYRYFWVSWQDNKRNGTNWDDNTRNGTNWEDNTRNGTNWEEKALNMSTIRVGKGEIPYTTEFMSWSGHEHDIHYVSVGNGHSTEGFWKFKIETTNESAITTRPTTVQQPTNYTNTTGFKSNINSTAERDLEQTVDYVTAVYISVPIVLVFLAVISVVGLFVSRRSQSKHATDTFCDGNESKAGVDAVPGVANVAHNSQPVEHKEHGAHFKGHVSTKDSHNTAMADYENTYYNNGLRTPYILEDNYGCEHVPPFGDVDITYCNTTNNHGEAKPETKDSTYSNIENDDASLYLNISIVHATPSIYINTGHIKTHQDDFADDQDPLYDHAIAGQRSRQSIEAGQYPYSNSIVEKIHHQKDIYLNSEEGIPSNENTETYDNVNNETANDNVPVYFVPESDSDYVNTVYEYDSVNEERRFVPLEEHKLYRDDDNDEYLDADEDRLYFVLEKEAYSPPDDDNDYERT